MASPTWWTWAWASSGSWWWTGKPGVLQSMGSQRVGHNWVTELNHLVVFPTFLNLSVNLAIRSSWWVTVSSWSWFCWLYRVFPSSAAKNIISLSLVLTIWWCSCVESSLVFLEEGVCYGQYVLLAKLRYTLPCFILYSEAKLGSYSTYLLTSYFCIPVPYDEKNISFWF